MAWTTIVPHSLAILAGDDSDSIVLNLMQPQAAGRQRVGFGGEARRNEAGRKSTRTGKHDVDINICDPPAGKPGPPGQDRLSAQASGRTTGAPCAPVSCELQLSGRKLEQAAPGDCQGRVASRRTLSPRRLHRDAHEPPGRARRCFLQQARDVRAMDQGGQRCDQVNATVVPNVRRQCGAAPASNTSVTRHQSQFKINLESSFISSTTKWLTKT